MSDGSGFQSTHPRAPASGWTGPVHVLTVVHPPELAGQSVRLRPDLTFGRSPDAGVVCIFHETISRRHAAVRAGLGGILCLEDLGSRNGTRVNGQRPELPTPLGPQSVVRLGDVHAVVDAPSDRRFGDDPVLPGTSARMARAREELERAARDPAAVLIIGETGAGKERLAKEVHRLSGRQGPFLALNCAELSPQLIESQLFGHERGAFTGASAPKAGLFTAADGGTLFLDEIGELPLELQPKLLRALQEGEVRPLGSVETRRVDVRVVAATNRDLPALVQDDRFRRDLYARLSLWEIRLPPLRERRQDLFSWIGLLLSVWNRERGANVELRFFPDAAERILLHPWLDNLRGLDRMVHRLASLGLDRSIGVRTLAEAMPELGAGACDSDPGASAEPRAASPSGGSTRPPGSALGDLGATGKRAQPEASRGVEASDPPANRRRPSREELLAVYTASGCSVRATSKHFGKDRRQIYRWLESFGIPRDNERE